MPQTSVGIFTVDRDLVIRSWDEWLYRVTGISADQAQGRRLADIVPDLESRGLREYFQRSLDEDVIEVLAPRFHHYLIPCRPPHPSRRFDRMQQTVTISPLRNDVETIGLIVTIEDVTDRVDTEDDASLIDAFDDANWATRRLAAQDMARQGSEQAVVGLLRVLCEQHRNISVLNSTLKVLTGSGLNVVPSLVELLNDSDYELRMYAALALGDLKKKEAAPALIRLLSDSDINVRYHAIEALAKIKAPEAINELFQIAESDDFFLAFPAIDALAQLDNPQIAVRLVPMLQREMVRPAIIDALGKLGDEQILPPLVALLDRPGSHLLPVADALAAIHSRYEQQFGEGEHIAKRVRDVAPQSAAQVLLGVMDETNGRQLRAIVRILSWIGGPGEAVVLTRLLGSQDVRKEVIEALVRHGKGVVDALVAQLQNSDIEVRRAAVVALARLGDSTSVPALMRLLKSDVELSIPVASALARIGDRRAYEPLRNLLGSAQAPIRQAAIAAISSLGDPRTSGDVRKMLSDPNPKVRESAVRIAGYFGYHVDDILERTRDPDEHVRRAAIESLPYIDSGNVLPVLMRSLQKEVPRNRAASAQALGHVDQREAIRVLIAALDDADAWVRYYAARSLGRLATPEALDRLSIAAKSDAATHVRIAAAEALAAIGEPEAAGVLSALLDSSERDLSNAAAIALGSIGHPDALPPLISLLRSKDRDKRLSAVNALAGRSDHEVIRALEWIAALDKDPDVASASVERLAALASPESLASVVRLTVQPALREACVVALSQIDASKLEILARGLDHPQKDVRCAVVDALGRRKHPAAADVLSRALDDEDPSVRSAAVLAFARLGSRRPERKLAAMAASDPDPAVRNAALRVMEP
jgi:HEAT repeat protein